MWTVPPAVRQSYPFIGHRSLALEAFQDRDDALVAFSHEPATAAWRADTRANQRAAELGCNAYPTRSPPSSRRWSRRGGGAAGQRQARTARDPRGRLVLHG